MCFFTPKIIIDCTASPINLQNFSLRIAASGSHSLGVQASFMMASLHRKGMAALGCRQAVVAECGLNQLWLPGSSSQAQWLWHDS